MRLSLWVVGALSCHFLRFAASLPLVPDPTEPTHVKGVDYSLSEDERRILNSVVENLGTLTLPKKTYDARKRMLFVAGLEGSGHHLISDMFMECKFLCSFADQIPRLLFDFVNCTRGVVYPWEKGFKPEAQKKNGLYRTASYAEHCEREFQPPVSYNGLFGVDGYVTHGDNVINIYKRMRDQATRTDSDSNLILLNPPEDDHVGQLSYPNFGGPLRNLHNPDLHVLAAIAEAARIDLRILVLQRPASEMYRSIVRRFNAKPSDLIDMATAASVLLTQLHQVDSSFYTCMSYQDFQDLRGGKGQKLADFLHPGLYKDQRMWQTMTKQINVTAIIASKTATRQSSGRGRGPGAKKKELGPLAYPLLRVQARLNKIQDLCLKNKNNFV